MGQMVSTGSDGDEVGTSAGSKPGPRPMPDKTGKIDKCDFRNAVRVILAQEPGKTAQCRDRHPRSYRRQFSQPQDSKYPKISLTRRKRARFTIKQIPAALEERAVLVCPAGCERNRACRFWLRRQGGRMGDRDQEWTMTAARSYPGGLPAAAWLTWNSTLVVGPPGAATVTL